MNICTYFLQFGGYTLRKLTVTCSRRKGKAVLIQWTRQYLSSCITMAHNRFLGMGHNMWPILLLF